VRPRLPAFVASVVLASLPAWQQAPVFRGAREIVAIPATVFDRYGELVTNLRASDFTIRDNGKVQEIANFTSGLQPITAAVLLDTSLSMTAAIPQARAAAEAFVDRLRPEDRAAVGLFSSRVTLSEPFTSDRDQLLRELHDDTSFSNPTRLFDAIDAAITALSPLDGRRIVLALTDGCDTQSTITWPALRSRVLAGDVMVYFIQFRTRLLLPGGGARNDCQRQAMAELPLTGESGRLNDPDRMVASNEVLSSLTTGTGGDRVILSSADEINSTFTQIMTELHYQYLLGFSPEKKDGRLHALQVTVNDKQLVVRARRSYQSAGKE
jgi:VWFA-related protein